MAPNVTSRKKPGTAVDCPSPGRMSARLASSVNAAAASTTTSMKMANPSSRKAPSRIVIVCLNCVASARKAATTVTSATVVVEAPGMNLAIRKTTRAPASSHSSGEKARRLPTLLIRCPARAG